MSQEVKKMFYTVAELEYKRSKRAAVVRRLWIVFVALAVIAITRQILELPK
jgi:hypothetical protein